MNAFSLEWADFRAYCFPPFSLLLRVLQKLERDEADYILVIPLWTTQVWVPKLLRLLTDFPVLPSRIDLCATPWQDNTICALSRKCWKNWAFQETLLKLFCLAGEMAQSNAQIHASNGWKKPLVHLKMNWLTVSLDFTKRPKESWIQCFEHVAQCCLYTVLKWRLFSRQPCSCPKMFKGRV